MFSLWIRHHYLFLVCNCSVWDTDIWGFKDCVWEFGAGIFLGTLSVVPTLISLPICPGHHGSLLHFCHYGFVVVKLWGVLSAHAIKLLDCAISCSHGGPVRAVIRLYTDIVSFVVLTSSAGCTRTQMIKHLQMHVPAHAHNPTHIWTVNLWHSRVCSGVCSGQALA